MAEDPGLMHRVKKEAILTRLQSGISFRVSNHSFFTRNNSWGTTFLRIVPPYSQNAGDASAYVTAWRPLAYHVSQLLYSYLILRPIYGRRIGTIP